MMKTDPKITCYLGDSRELKDKILNGPVELRDLFLSLCEKIAKLSNIGTALSAEHNLPKLLEMILEEARGFTNADGGTLYLMTPSKDTMIFEIVQTDSLNIRMGGTSGNPINWYPVKLHLENKQPNHAMVSAYVALTGETVNIDDVYDVKGFDFTGTKAFDKKTGYRSKSMLVVPMKNYEDEIIGVLQLINAQHITTKESIAFSQANQNLIISLASQAAIAITNTRLIRNLEELFQSFIKSIASAIDEKSEYTGGHIERVAELTTTVAQKLNDAKTGQYASFSITDNEMEELRTAAWMHDIGKITTPEYVVDKGTKLETIYDRITEVETRIEILKRDAKIHYLEELLQLKEYENPEKQEILKNNYTARLSELDEHLAFIKIANVGGEFMAPDKKERVKQIGKEILLIANKSTTLLTENEIYNLCIPKGTLTNEERQVINNHVSVTIKMLEQLPYPNKLKRVPEFAGGHHEKLDGSGYPKGLTEEQLSPQTKIMALADIFEALTAKDRPYKKGKTLSQAMRIMGFMAKDRHIDPNLFKFFVKEKIYLDYANQFMDPAQIDTVNEEDFLK